MTLRPSRDDPRVAALLARLGHDAEALVDLGGTMSLNLHAPDAGFVVRVHPQLDSRDRLDRLQALRQELGAAGLAVAVPIEVDGARLLEADGLLAEIEPYLASTKPAPTWDSYVWMFRAMGELHRPLSTMPGDLPDPVVATYGTPASIGREARRTADAVRDDADADPAAIAERVLDLVDRLAAVRPDASRLPSQIVHGDVRLGNVVAGVDGRPVYFDFGFAARRPRIHELAYSLSWIVLRPDDSGRAEDFDWGRVTELLAAYEEGAGHRLTTGERRALGPYLAAVPLQLAAIAHHSPDPAAVLRGEVPFLRIAEWVLDHHDEIVP